MYSDLPLQTGDQSQFQCAGREQGQVSSRGRKDGAQLISQLPPSVPDLIYESRVLLQAPPSSTRARNHSRVSTRSLIFKIYVKDDYSRNVQVKPLECPPVTAASETLIIREAAWQRSTRNYCGYCLRVRTCGVCEGCRLACVGGR